MRRFCMWCSIIGSGIISLAVLALAGPLLAALRVDARERRAREDLAKKRWPDIDMKADW